MKEDDLLRTVVEWCRYRHILTFHARPARTAQGWRTPVMGDGAGFPDLVMVGVNGTLYRELKANDARLTPSQKVWMERLAIAGEDCGIWRPRDLGQGTIKAALDRISSKDLENRP